jgi:hypothetical protein
MNQECDSGLTILNYASYYGNPRTKIPLVRSMIRRMPEPQRLVEAKEGGQANIRSQRPFHFTNKDQTSQKN